MSTLSQFANGDPVYWVSGTTYSRGRVVRSPADNQTYVRIVDGAGTTDPSSDTTNWRPDVARAIKSIQRGVITIPFGAGAATATISAVNTAKTELRLLGGSSVANGGGLSARVSLTDSTTITANYPDSGNPCPVNWELTEFY